MEENEKTVVLKKEMGEATLTVAVDDTEKREMRGLMEEVMGEIFENKQE